MKLAQKYAIALHGGAGTISAQTMSAKQEYEYKTALREALYQGTKVLEIGGSALKAVTEAVVCLEDCELFNAGKGSVFDWEGKHLTEAALMDGKTLQAGAVANIQMVKNPVLLAKVVMKKSRHLFLSGEEALEFARKNALALEEKDYFFTKIRHNQWKAARKDGKIYLDHDGPADLPQNTQDEWGTVGAVAIDRRGNLAAATSTGGMTGKRYGRIGDSCMIGIGTYADNQTVGVSCTGKGEFFIRVVAAHALAAQLKYTDTGLKVAAQEIIEQIKNMGGKGGMIAIDKQGNIAMPFSSRGMYRACKRQEEEEFIGIYKESSHY